MLQFWLSAVGLGIFKFESWRLRWAPEDLIVGKSGLTLTWASLVAVRVA
jgi:hypothetical protein